MALESTPKFQPVTWQDVADPGSAPPDAPQLEASELNRIESGINEAVNHRIPVYVVDDLDKAVPIDGTDVLYIVKNTTDHTFDLVLVDDSEDTQNLRNVQSPAQSPVQAASDRVTDIVADALLETIADKLKGE